MDKVDFVFDEDGAEEVRDEEEQAPDEMAQMTELNVALMHKLKQISADYENFRKRNEKEKARMYDMGVMAFAEGLLPIIDNFALAMKSASPGDNFAKGMLMIQNQLNHMFEDMGMKKIPAVGETFDIKYHNAVSHIEDENAGAQEIVEELQPGYMYKEAVIRHSVVVVAN